jgi:hypothetical protein
MPTRSAHDRPNRDGFAMLDADLSPITRTEMTTPC